MSIACPVCESVDTAVLGPPFYRHPPNVAGVPIDLSDVAPNWWRCNACAYQFIHPRIPEERLLACYRQAATGHWATASSVNEARLYAEKKRLLERFIPGKRVLDFGCFDGGFLEYLGPGYETFGIEPSTDAARVAERRGVKVLGPTLATVVPSADIGASPTPTPPLSPPLSPPLPPMDAIISFDVFEHLTDPVGTLRDLRRLLRVGGGIIMIETGDTDAPSFKRAGLRYSYAALVEHVGLFNRSSIRAAGARAGLELVHFEPSAHHLVPLRLQVMFRLYNSAYYALRGLDAVRVPLPLKLRRIARGPVPRSSARDHFLAILRAG